MIANMAINVHSFAATLHDVDPADVDSDAMKEDIDSILADLTVIRRFVRKTRG
jgi:hypothetical protein